MTSAPVRGLICSLAVPTIISMLVTALYNLVGTYFVSGISTQATAAVGIAFPLMSVIQAIGYFFGHGSGNFISRRLGAREVAVSQQMSVTGFAYALLFGAFLAVLGEIFLEPLCRALGSTPTILPYTIDYVRIILLGAPLMIGSLVLNTQLRFQGHAIYSMVGIVAGAVFNVALTPFLIFGYGMGIEGAALAAVISQSVSFFILLLMDKWLSPVPMKLRNFSLSAFFRKEIVHGGMPSLCRQLLACTATLLLNHAAKEYGGDAAIAAMSIVNRVIFFLFAFMLGLGHGFQPVCGYNYGAGRYDRVRQGYWFCVKSGAMVLLLFSLTFWNFAEEVIAAFRDEAAVVSVGAEALRWQLAVLPLNALVSVSNMMMQTIRKSTAAVVLASARHGLFFIPLIFILSSSLGMRGVVMCQSVSDILSLALTVPFVVCVLREMKKQEARLKKIH